MIQRLREDKGVHWPQLSHTVQTAGRLQGRSYVLTGSLKTMTRDEASDKLKALGAKVTASISKNTSALIAGDKAGSKLQKAEKLGIEVMTEETFLALLDD